MKEINTPKEHDGYIYTITSVKEHSAMECPQSCWHLKHNEECYYADDFRKHNIAHDKGVFNCIEIVVNVKNVGHFEDWFVGPEDIKMVDSEGFIYEGYIPSCEELFMPRMSRNRTAYLPGTQTNYIQFFPSLPGKTYIKYFRVDIHHKAYKYYMSDDETEPLEGIKNQVQSAEDIDIMDEQKQRELNYKLDNARRSLNYIKKEIFELLNNDITSSEKTKLENHIRSDFYSIKLDLEEGDTSAFQEMKDNVVALEEDYNLKLKEKEKEDIYKREKIKKIEDLLQLTPRQFEEYVAQLFEALGYKVEITPLSNDKGSDIIMYKDDMKYVVQCKRYKGTVGSPEIQTFIGSMTHYNADKGFYVTTGMFSFEAENMASKHPIKLINRTELVNMIIKVFQSSHN